MLSFIPKTKESEPLRILCLGAHSDDIEIGCGGTMMELARNRSHLDVHWVVFSGNHGRAEEARTSAAFWLEGVERKEVVMNDFKDGYFPDNWARIKECFEHIKSGFSPDLVFTHCAADKHQDHRIVNELTWNTFRNHTIFEYEIPKYDGDLGTPNAYVPLAEETARDKAAALVKHFGSQGAKHWFREELFLGLMRIRGAESCAVSGYAEGFHVRKLALQL